MENSSEIEKGEFAKAQALNLAKNGLNKSLVRNIVIKTTEFLLPIIFWLGMLVIIITSFSIASSQYRFWSQVTTFFATLIPYALAFIVSFYFIYLLKDIKDSLQK